jgi:hypothetical protein
MNTRANHRRERPGGLSHAIYLRCFGTTHVLKCYRFNWRHNLCRSAVKLNDPRQPSHARCQQKAFWRWASFSATNIFKSSPTSNSTSKQIAHLVLLSRLTQEGHGRFFTLFLPVRTSVMDATVQLCRPERFRHHA